MLVNGKPYFWSGMCRDRQQIDCDPGDIKEDKPQRWFLVLYYVDPSLEYRIWKKNSGVKLKKTLSWHFPQLKTHQSKTFFLEREIFELDFKVFYLTSAHTSFFQIKLWKVAMIFNIIWKSRKNASNWRKQPMSLFFTSDELFFRDNSHFQFQFSATRCLQVERWGSKFFPFPPFPFGKCH